MRKTIFVSVVLSSLFLVACADERPYSDYQDAPQAHYNDESFIDEHGDALLAGGAGYLAGKAMAGNSHRPTTKVIERRTYVYRDRPKPTFKRSYSSRRSFTSRRR